MVSDGWLGGRGKWWTMSRKSPILSYRSVDEELMWFFSPPHTARTTADQSPLPVFIYNFPAVVSGR